MPKYYTLDGLRGFAALAVVAFHMPGPVHEAAQSAYLAVDLFFALSGFVLAKAYDARIAEGMSVREFARIRFIRLYPLLVLGAAIAVIVNAGGIFLGVADGDAAHFALQGASAALAAPLSWRDDQFLFDLNVPEWSLFFEIVVNLVFVTTWLFLSKHLVKVVAIGAAVLIGAVFYYGHAEIGAEWESFAGGFARVAFSFFAGVLLYRWRDTLPAPALPAWGPPLILIAALMFGPPDFKTLYDLACILLLFPMLILSASRVEPAGGLRGTYAFLGGASYAIYVLHFPFCRAFNNLDIWMEETPALMAAGGIGMMAGIVALAALADRYYDAPVRRWLTARLAQRAAA